MSEAGVRKPEPMHYGEEKSRDDFGDESVGLINGCMDPGDGYVLDLLTELNVDACPEQVDPNDSTLEDPDRPDAHCEVCGGDGCSECEGTGLKRAVGREFVGPDADTADALLASDRENHVAQATERYVRSPDDPENTAMTYVRTDAFPVGFADHQVSGVEWIATDLQRAIVDTLRSTPTRLRGKSSGSSSARKSTSDKHSRNLRIGRLSCISAGAASRCRPIPGVCQISRCQHIDLETSQPSTTSYRSLIWGSWRSLPPSYDRRRTRCRIAVVTIQSGSHRG